MDYDLSNLSDEELDNIIAVNAAKPVNAMTEDERADMVEEAVSGGSTPERVKEPDVPYTPQNAGANGLGAVDPQYRNLRAEDFSNDTLTAAEQVALNRQAETGMASEHDGTFWGGVKSVLQSMAHNSTGKLTETSTSKAQQAIVRGYVDVGDGRYKPLDAMTDEEQNILMDEAGANGAMRYFGSFIPSISNMVERGDDDLMKQWDRGEGRKYADPDERRLKRAAYMQDIMRGVVSEKEGLKQAAEMELANRESSFGGELLAGLYEQGAYTGTYVAGSVIATMLGAPVVAGAVLPGLIEGGTRFGERRLDELGTDADGNIGVTAERDDFGTALRKGAMRGAIAPTIEMVGGKVIKPLGWVAKAALGKIPLFKAVGNSAVATTAGRAVDAWMKRMRLFGKLTGMQSMPEEALEEFEDQVIDAALGLDRNDSAMGDTTTAGRALESAGEFMKPENLGDLAKSMLLMQVLQSGIAYQADRSAARNWTGDANAPEGQRFVSETDSDKIVDNTTGAVVGVKGRNLDAMLMMAGVDANELKYYTAPEKAAAVNAWIGSMTDEEVAKTFKGAEKAVAELTGKMSEAGRAFDFGQRGVNEVDAVFTIGEFVPTEDGHGNQVERMEDVRSGVSIDMVRGADGGVSYRVRDGFGNIRAAADKDKAIAYADNFARKNATRAAKMQYVEQQRRGGLLSGVDVIYGANMEAVMDELQKRGYDSRRVTEEDGYNPNNPGFHVTLQNGSHAVCIVLDNNADVRTMNETIAHEAGTHWGFQELRKSGELGDFFKKLSKSGLAPTDRIRFDTAASNIAQQYGIEPKLEAVLANPAAAEELWAYTTETMADRNPSVKERFVASLREWWRKRFDADLQLNGDEIYVMANAMMNDRRGADGGTATMARSNAESQDEATRRREALDADLEAARRTQGGIVIRRNMEGQPLMLTFDPMADVTPNEGAPKQLGYTMPMGDGKQDWEKSTNPGIAWGEIVRNGPSMLQSMQNKDRSEPKQVITANVETPASASTETPTTSQETDTKPVEARSGASDDVSDAESATPLDRTGLADILNEFLDGEENAEKIKRIVEESTDTEAQYILDNLDGEMAGDEDADTARAIEQVMGQIDERKANEPVDEGTDNAKISKDRTALKAEITAEIVPAMTNLARRQKVSESKAAITSALRKLNRRPGMPWSLKIGGETYSLEPDQMGRVPEKKLKRFVAALKPNVQDETVRKIAEFMQPIFDELYDAHAAAAEGERKRVKAIQKERAKKGVAKRKENTAKGMTEKQLVESLIEEAYDAYNMAIDGVNGADAADIEKASRRLDFLREALKTADAEKRVNGAEFDALIEKYTEKEEAATAEESSAVQGAADDDYNPLFDDSPVDPDALRRVVEATRNWQAEYEADPLAAWKDVLDDMDPEVAKSIRDNYEANKDDPEFARAQLERSIAENGPRTMFRMGKANNNAEVKWRMGGANAANKRQLAHLDAAKNMEGMGFDRKDIWKETGWWRGEDGKWRFEFDDYKFLDPIAFILTDMKDGKIKRDAFYFSDLLEDDEFKNGMKGNRIPLMELFAQYPKAKDLKVFIASKSSMGDSEGSYNEATNAIKIREDVIDEGGRDAAQTLAHELQHFVQHQESFARGGDTSEFRQREIKDPKLRKAANEVAKGFQDAGFVFEDKWLNLNLARKIGNGEFETLDKYDQDHLEDYIGVLRNLAPKYGFGNDWQRFGRTLFAERDKQSAFSQYENLAGEREARLNERRFTMDEDERNSEAPFETLDKMLKEEGYDGIEPTIRWRRGISDRAIASLGPKFAELDRLATNKDTPEIRWRRAKESGLFFNGTIEDYMRDRRRKQDEDVKYAEEFIVRWRRGVKSAGKYAGELRNLAHGMKLGDMRSMVVGADMMAPLIPQNAVIVPMPNHEGKPIRTMLLGYCISGVRDDVDVVPALLVNPHDGSYHDKKIGKRPKLTMRRDWSVEIPKGRPVVVIDNVIASGATWDAAKAVLPDATLVTLADASRGRRKTENDDEDVKNLADFLRHPNPPMSMDAFKEKFGSRNIDGGETSTMWRTAPVTPAEDAAYMDAVKRGDMETAARMVREAAAKAGYIDDSSYQGMSAFNGSAPSANGYYANKEERKDAWEDGSYEGEATFGDYIFDGIDINNLEVRLNDREWRYATPERKEAIENLNSVLSSKGRTIRMFRSVPSDVKEGSFRNGDWITPSRSYAVENARIHGWGKKFRIVEQEVSVEEIWWDGNDIAEWGFDDGKEYAYRNTKNNRKLLAPVTYDDAGNVIPLSQRFDTQNPDIRWRRSGLYTGSAADYEKPSLLKVGTGEGSQVYGWGLYASDVRGVAEGYAARDKRKKEGDWRNGEYFKDGQPIPPYDANLILRDNATPMDIALNAYVYAKGNVQKALASLNTDNYSDIHKGKIIEAQMWLGDKKNLDTLLAEVRQHNSNIYEQTFFTNRAPGDESHLIEWFSSKGLGGKNGLVKRVEQALSPEEAEKFRREINRHQRNYGMGRIAVFGKDLYEITANILGGYKEASEFLRDKLDVDGVKYPVGSNNGGGIIPDGNKVGWNYVSFRDDNIRVDHKWVDGQLLWRRRYTPDPELQRMADLRELSADDAAELRDILANGEAAYYKKTKAKRDLLRRGTISQAEQMAVDATTQPGFGNKAKGWGRFLASKEPWMWLREKAQDSLISLREEEKNRNIKANDSAYHALDAAYGKMANDIKDFNDNTVDPFEKELAAKKFDDAKRKRLDMLLQALHGEEANRMVAERSDVLNKARKDENAKLIIEGVLNGTVPLNDTTVKSIADWAGLKPKEKAQLKWDLQGSGKTTAFWKKLLDNYRATGFYDECFTPSVAGGRSLVDFAHEITKKTREILVQTGRLSRKQADLWEQLSPNYVPFQSDFETESSAASTFFGLGHNKQDGGGIGNYDQYANSEFHHSFGRRTIADSPIDAAIRQFHDAVARARDNEARHKMADIVRANPKMGYVFRFLSQDDRKRLAKEKAILENIVAAGTATPAQMSELNRVNAALEEANRADKAIPTTWVYGDNGVKHEVPVVSGLEGGKSNPTSVIAFKEDGDLKFIKLGGFTQDEVNDGALSDRDALRIATAVKYQNMVSNDAIRRLRTLTGLFSMARTSLVPTFIMSNFLADTTQAALNLSATYGKGGMAKFLHYRWNSIKAARDFLANINRENPNDTLKYAEEWAANGGMIGGRTVETLREINGAIARDVRKLSRSGLKDIHSAKDLVQFLMDKGRGVMSFAEYWNSVVEMSTRIAAYATVRDMQKANGETAANQAENIAKAVSYSRDVTVNFNRKGTLGNIINAWWAFGNANMQDIQRSLHALGEGDATGFTLGLGRAGFRVGKAGLKMWGALTALQFVASVLGHMLGDDPEDEKEGIPQFKDTPDYLKKSKLGILAGPNVRGINRSPMYFGASLFDVAFGHKGVLQAAKENLGLLASHFFDFSGDTGEEINKALPSVVRPVFELQQNKNFMGQQIYREPFFGDKDNTTVRSELGKKQTSGLSKSVARALNWMTGGSENKRGMIDVQPEKVSAVVDWIFGGMTKDVREFSQTFADLATFNAPTMKNVPFLNRLVKQRYENSANYNKALERYDALVAEYEADIKDGNMDAAADMEREHPFLNERRSKRWNEELKQLKKIKTELQKAETKAETQEDYEKIHALRMKTQYLFIHRLETPPQGDAEDAGLRQHNRIAERFVKKRRADERRAKKQEERESDRRKRGIFK